MYNPTQNISSVKFITVDHKENALQHLSRDIFATYIRKIFFKDKSLTIQYTVHFAMISFVTRTTLKWQRRWRYLYYRKMYHKSQSENEREI